MEKPQDKTQADDVEAWVTIAVIDVVATAAVCGLFIWLNAAMS